MSLFFSDQHVYECRELPVARQVSLLETLAAAASQMAPGDKARPGAGPPPLLILQRALPPADHLKPQHLKLFLAATPAESVIGDRLIAVFAVLCFSSCHA